MIKVDFTEHDAERISELKDNHPKPIVRKRMLALWLKYLGSTHQEICRIANISKPSLANFLTRFRDEGLDSLLVHNFKGRTSKLDPYSTEIIRDFEARPPHSLAEGAGRIKETIGVSISQPRLSAFLARNGIRRLKTGTAPGKIDPALQEDFKKKTWSPH
jgi:transposase